METIPGFCDRPNELNSEFTKLKLLENCCVLSKTTFDIMPTWLNEHKELLSYFITCQLVECSRNWRRQIAIILFKPTVLVKGWLLNDSARGTEKLKISGFIRVGVVMSKIPFFVWPSRELFFPPDSFCRDVSSRRGRFFPSFPGLDGAPRRAELSKLDLTFVSRVSNELFSLKIFLAQSVRLLFFPSGLFCVSLTAFLYLCVTSWVAFCPACALLQKRNTTTF